MMISICLRSFLIAFFFSVFTFVNHSFGLEGNNVVGFLVTKKENYEYEVGRETEPTRKLLQSLGAKVVVIDYNELINSKNGIGSLDKKIEDFIKENSITKVLIPGNYYNIDLPPYPLTPNRQLATESLVRMANDRKIYLMGICGGMQGILHAEGLKISNIKKILAGNIEQPQIQQSQVKPDDVRHSQSYQDLIPREIVLENVKIDPLSSIAKVISGSNVDVDKNGWLEIKIPHIHSEAFDNSDVKNVDKLLSLGYKILGFANDGIVEIVEDKNGNVHLQSHPEIMLIYEDSIVYKDQEIKKKSVAAMKMILSDFIDKK